MSPARLAQFNLQENDTEIASDHLPKITDFIVKKYTSRSKTELHKHNIIITPSSETGIYFISSTQKKNIQSVEIYDNSGKLIFQKQNIKYKMYKLNISAFIHGLYIIKVQSENKTETLKILF